MVVPQQPAVDVRGRPTRAVGVQTHVPNSTWTQISPAHRQTGRQTGEVDDLIQTQNFDITKTLDREMVNINIDAVDSEYKHPIYINRWSK